MRRRKMKKYIAIDKAPFVFEGTLKKLHFKNIPPPAAE
jgi:hypothetical protein